MQPSIVDVLGEILDFLQDYYKKNGIAPMVRILSKNTGYKLKEVGDFYYDGGAELRIPVIQWYR